MQRQVSLWDCGQEQNEKKMHHKKRKKEQRMQLSLANAVVAVMSPGSEKKSFCKQCLSKTKPKSVHLEETDLSETFLVGMVSNDNTQAEQEDTEENGAHSKNGDT